MEVLDNVVDYHIAHEGISRLEKIFYCHKHFLGIELSEIELAELAGKYSSLVKQAVIECDSVPGALNFLQSYCATLPMFLVSGTPEGELKEIIKERGLNDYFTSVHGSPRRKAPIVNEQIQLYGFDRKRCLFVGDAKADYEAATETGIVFIGRVAQGCVNLFPNGTKIIKDLTKLVV